MCDEVKLCLFLCHTHSLSNDRSPRHDELDAAAREPLGALAPFHRAAPDGGRREQHDLGRREKLAVRRGGAARIRAEQPVGVAAKDGLKKGEAADARAHFFCQAATHDLSSQRAASSGLRYAARGSGS